MNAVTNQAGCLIVEVYEHWRATSSSSDARNDQESANSPLFYLLEGGRYGHGRDAGLSRLDAAGSEKHAGPNGVEVYRTIMRATDDLLWNDLKEADTKIGGVWSDTDALEVEAAIVVRLKRTRVPDALDCDYAAAVFNSRCTCISYREPDAELHRAARYVP